MIYGVISVIAESIFGVVGKKRWIAYTITPTSNPIPIPRNATSVKVLVASHKLNCPVMMAASANRNTIRLDASFTRLSPSRMVTTLFGMRKSWRTVVAATASGGEIIPPSRNPNASEKPGIMAF